MNTTSQIHAALQEFAAAVTDKLTQITLGEREEQLRAPFENFMGAAATRSVGMSSAPAKHPCPTVSVVLITRCI